MDLIGFSCFVKHDEGIFAAQFSGILHLFGDEQALFLREAVHDREPHQKLLYLFIVGIVQDLLDKRPDSMAQSHRNTLLHAKHDQIDHRYPSPGILPDFQKHVR